MILDESNTMPSMASALMQRWALMFNAYTYSIKYRKGKDMCNADTLSHFPLADYPESAPKPPPWDYCSIRKFGQCSIGGFTDQKWLWPYSGKSQAVHTNWVANHYIWWTVTTLLEWDQCWGWHSIMGQQSDCSTTGNFGWFSKTWPQNFTLPWQCSLPF